MINWYKNLEENVCILIDILHQNFREVTKEHHEKPQTDEIYLLG
jgi:hypothetical protein